METTQDYYTILGISHLADAMAIKNAYRKLAFQYHPDHNSLQTASATFLQIKKAYEVLSNPKLKAQYDLKLYYNAAGKKSDTISYTVLLQFVNKLSALTNNSPTLYVKSESKQAVEWLLQKKHLQYLSIHCTKEERFVFFEKLIEIMKQSSPELIVAYVAILLRNDSALLTTSQTKDYEQLYKKAQLQLKLHRYKPILAILLALMLIVFIYMIT